MEEKKEKIKNILKTYNLNEYRQLHIQYYDLIAEIGDWELDKKYEIYLRR